MKRKIIYFCTLLVIGITQNVYAQSRMGFGDQQQIYPPNTYALARYGDIPVDYVSGVPNISIPLMSLVDKDIDLDISLSYHAGGIKVDQEATWVGLGWVLNAGGVITRRVRGKPDGATRTSIPDYDYKSPIKEYVDQTAGLVSSANLSTDNEPDIFIYNFCGKTGRFMFNNDWEVCFFNHEDFKVEFGNDFTITDNSGVKYEFKATESARLNPHTHVLGASYIKSWYLTKIIGPAGGEITFSYTNGGAISSRYTRRQHSSCFIAADPKNTVAHQIDVLTYPSALLTSDDISTDGLLPSRITTSTGHSIRFAKGSTLRKDSELTSYPLDNITIYDNQNYLKKKIQFGYGYFEANNKGRYRLQNQELAAYGHLNYRLRLETVREISTSGDSEGVYRFDYFGDDDPQTEDVYTLPYRLSPCQDHWGYFNYSYNQSIFANNSYARHIGQDAFIEGYFSYYDSFYSLPFNRHFLGTEVVIGGGSRDPHAEGTKAAMLNKITYPTGGYTKFDYEQHSNGVGATVIAGGLRIKQIESNDGNGNTIIKNYKYVPYGGTGMEWAYTAQLVSRYHTYYYNPYTESTTSGVPEIWIAMGVPPPLTTELDIIRIDATSQMTLGLERSALYYEVTESIPETGKTVYRYLIEDNDVLSSGFYINGKQVTDGFKFGYFSTASDAFDIPHYTHWFHTSYTFPYPEPINYDWRSGLLTSKCIYREDNQLISQDSIYYDIQTLHAVPGYKAVRLSEHRYLYARSYTLAGSVKVQKEINRTIVPGQGVVRRETEHIYGSPYHKQVTEIKTESSTGETITTKYYYPTEYGNTLSALKNKNMLLPVDVRTYVGTKLVSGIQTQYNAKGQVQTLFRTETNSNDIAFNSQNPYTFSSFLSNTFYDTGELKSQNITGQPDCFYLWSYQGQYPVAEIRNATESQIEAAVRSVFSVASLSAFIKLTSPNETKLMDGSLHDALPNAHITTYTYKSLNGISSITDSRKITTYYEYDSSGRLCEIYYYDNNVKTSANKRILESYSYGYKNR